MPKCCISSNKNVIMQTISQLNALGPWNLCTISQHGNRQGRGRVKLDSRRSRSTNISFVFLPQIREALNNTNSENLIEGSLWKEHFICTQTWDTHWHTFDTSGIQSYRTVKYSFTWKLLMINDINHLTR